ncbi:HNH endonuclease [Alteriqipengyuania flavescens]|uniref:HNH endonuclease n=1 Tax=Alteriqipengyuania flavescens TaxID=3053610 RepID=UPI0025B2F1BB|nr:HNH endonuclease [Alteriqipengyuania flavescens]WJY18087.1 HNH endonuclease [Alteriqipengyuania flavescens]WJY24028.1 HNH endonuclease [Alteriqipengyuania flavescens]
MTFGVFMHKDGSIYDDIPEVHYQFPKGYLSRAQQMVGDWIDYREPVKIPNSKGFFAVAKVEEIIPDPTEPDRYRAIIEAGSYLPFEPTVPHIVNGEQVERGVLNEEGKVSGRAQAAVRPLSPSDFARIVRLGLPEDDTLPRVGDAEPLNRVQDTQTPFEIERPIVQSLVNRPFRDKAFRRAVLHAYDGRCAVTGWRLVNGGGRLEAEAAHIRPVEHGGPDSIRNGLALSGTAHWMFDRGLIGVEDDHTIVIHRKVNDRDGVQAIINPTGKLIAPERASDRPHPQFLGWHRDHHLFAA